MKKRSAIKTDLFADTHHREKLDKPGGPLMAIEACIDFAALAAEVDRIAPRPVGPEGDRSPLSTETMVRIRVLKRPYDLSDEQMEYQLLDRMSGKRCCGLVQAMNIPDRTTVWPSGNRTGEAGAKAVFEGVTAQLLENGFIARAAGSSMPRGFRRRSSTSPGMTGKRSKRVTCQPPGNPPSAARKTWMRPGPGSMASATMATSSMAA